MSIGNELNMNTITGRMRFLTGDYIIDEPYLEDAIYLHLYAQEGSSEIDGAVAALESIINNIALSPAKWRSDGVWEEKQSLAALEERLKSLKAKQRGNKIPIVMSSDRKNWDDFDKVFK